MLSILLQFKIVMINGLIMIFFTFVAWYPVGSQWLRQTGQFCMENNSKSVKDHIIAKYAELVYSSGICCTPENFTNACKQILPLQVKKKNLTCTGNKNSVRFPYQISPKTIMKIFMAAKISPGQHTLFIPGKHPQGEQKLPACVEASNYWNSDSITSAFTSR